MGIEPVGHVAENGCPLWFVEYAGLRSTAPPEDFTRLGRVTRYVAFLLAMNVGTTNRVKMTDLAAMFVEAGCSDVSSYLQSGNLLFMASSAKEPEALAQQIEATLVGHGMKRADAIVRKPADLERLVARQPFAGVDPDVYHRSVSFLRSPPTATPTDRLTREGAEVTYLDDSVVCVAIPRVAKLTGGASTVIDKSWGTASTTRWWNVVEEMTRRALTP